MSILRFLTLTRPMRGGLHTFSRALRLALEPHGIEVRWVAFADEIEDLFTNSAWATELSLGEAIEPGGSDGHTRARTIIRYIESQRFNGVFFHAMSSPLALNCARYLPANHIKFMVVHNTTPGTYGPASAVRDFIHATVTVSPRIREDLVTRKGFNPDTTHFIHTGLDFTPFAACNKNITAHNGPLRIVSLGRFDEAQKGVLWLPKIMDNLMDCNCELTAYGEGPDGDRLRRASVNKKISIKGVVEPHDVASILSTHDVFLFPSRYEGLGLALLEGMAAGCVPVASRLSGVTDSIVSDGDNGFLFPVGDVVAAAGIIRRLAANRALCSKLALAARTTVQDRFSIESMGGKYAALIDNIRVNRPSTAAPLPINSWSYPAAMRRRWQSFIPARAKLLWHQWHARRG